MGSGESEMNPIDWILKIIGDPHRIRQWLIQTKCKHGFFVSHALDARMYIAYCGKCGWIERSVFHKDPVKEWQENPF